MGSQSIRESFNLGGYTIRPDDSQDINVGSFYRRARNINNNNNNEESLDSQNASNPELTSSEITNKASSSLGNTSTQTSSEFTSQMSSQPYRASSSERSVGQKRSLEERLSSHEDLSSLTAASNSNHFLSQPETTQASKTIGSRESMVISINPDALLSDEESNETANCQRTQDKDIPLSYSQETPKVMVKKIYPKKLPYDKIMGHVTFVMSGYENPRRATLRDMALKMGAKYSPKWTRFCTHLICAFKNTPKYKEVMAENGRIVREHWIQDCSRQEQLLDWRNYKLGKYPYPDSEEEVDVDDLDYALEVSKMLRKRPRYGGA